MKMKKNIKKKLGFLSGKSAMLILTAIFIIIFIFLVKSMIKDYQVESDVKKLEAEITALEQENLQLNELSQYFASDIFIEEQARTKLGLKKPGEEGIVIKDFDILTGTNQKVNKPVESVEGSNKNVIYVPNYKKWWMYFFASQ